MATVTMTMEEYLQLINGLSSDSAMIPGMSSDMVQVQAEPKPKKKMTAYQKRYRSNFRKIQADYKLKNGNWKKNGFKMAVKMAHKMSKK